MFASRSLDDLSKGVFDLAIHQVHIGKIPKFSTANLIIIVVSPFAWSLVIE